MKMYFFSNASFVLSLCLSYFCQASLLMGQEGQECHIEIIIDDKTLERSHEQTTENTKEKFNITFPFDEEYIFTGQETENNLTNFDNFDDELMTKHARKESRTTYRLRTSRVISFLMKNPPPANWIQSLTTKNNYKDLVIRVKISQPQGPLPKENMYIIEDNSIITHMSY